MSFHALGGQIFANIIDSYAELQLYFQDEVRIRRNGSKMLEFQPNEINDKFLTYALSCFHPNE